ncbi:DUF397 domain-containing protein [Streptomyces sp. TS71-3]|uniref:DUF397 domain-containing protein n=1 Tax=Streptomyces sp. TS71-3 TaxID=2733862 RepID=UPI001B1CC603|nr:DUF397 domain-containing protein [Streptomyces sp. TS71-3]GHJ36623.1 hypothetical protein Sm713_22320 [Streptomyces sp. TS71-3]
MIPSSTQPGVIWRKSSYSSDNGGNCLEVADGQASAVPVRDSKNPNGPVLLFAPTAWSAFVSAVRQDEPRP